MASEDISMNDTITLDFLVPIKNYVEDNVSWTIPDILYRIDINVFSLDTVIKTVKGIDYSA